MGRLTDTDRHPGKWKKRVNDVSERGGKREGRREREIDGRKRGERKRERRIK